MTTFTDKYRRRLVGAGLGMFAASLAVDPLRPLYAQEATSRPDPKTLQKGDLVWPKKPGVFVPYNSQGVSTFDEDRRRWNQERVEFIIQARRPPPSTSKEEAEYLERVAANLERLTFEQFYHGYAAGVTPETFVAQGGGSYLYVGHVGIIDVDAAGEPWVIEAIINDGDDPVERVRRVQYLEWLKRRGEINVWHARLKGVAESARANVANEANRYLGRPYKFWRFRLDDSSGFYCSKLVWLSVFTATRIVLDDEPNPMRLIWYSPLQLTRSKYLERLHWPGSYRNL